MSMSMSRCSHSSFVLQGALLCVRFLRAMEKTMEWNGTVKERREGKYALMSLVSFLILYIGEADITKM